VPHREILWNVPSWLMLAVYLGSAITLTWVLAWFVKRSQIWRLGRRSDSELGLGAGLSRLVAYLLTHRTIGRDRYAGVMHLLVFWGFAVLLAATTLVAIQHHAHVEFLQGTTYLVFSLCADLGGSAFCAGIAMAIWRRRRSPSRLLASRATNWMLWGLLVVALTGFMVEGARIAHDFPDFEKWSPVGYATAIMLRSVGLDGPAAIEVHRYSWIFHAVLVMGFFVIVPLTLLRHIVTGAYSVIHAHERPGTLDNSDWKITAAVDLADFRRLDLLQADACLTCGRCTTVCPAEIAGKPLSPRSVVLGLRQHMANPDVPLSEQIADDAIWSCTTCNACDLACPVDIDIVEKIVTLRRGRVAQAAVPNPAAKALESTAQKFNPYDQANSTRMDWASGLDVPIAENDEPIELLYWVGCGGAFDPAGRAVTRAMIRILNHLKVNYRVLGCRERCSGDPARRLGEEELWRELKEANQTTFASHRVETVVTHCPHCFNAFQNEYTGTDSMPEVVHHSQWLRDRLGDGALQLRAGSAERITFHDPCYLARVNAEIAAPRSILDSMYQGRRIEMSQHGAESFCCGGGGGQMWLDVPGRQRVETIRAAQIEQTGADVVATACPFCRVMLEAGRDGLDENQGKWNIKDIAELAAENLLGSDA